MTVAVDGSTVGIDAVGAPEAPPVVLVHGAGVDRRMWSNQVPALAAAGFRVFAVDLPGNGGSQGAPLASIAEAGAWAVRLFDALGLEATRLVGLSMGALVALEAAARAPERVERLVLAGVAARMPVNPELMEMAARDDSEAYTLIGRWSHARAEHAAATAAMIASGRPGVLHAGLRACDAYADAAATASGVRCPTLLLLGEDDLMTKPKAAAPLAAAIADARTVLLPGCGHLMTADDAGACNDALIGFLGE